MINIENNIEDIVAFADPFTDFKAKQISGKTRIEFTRKGRDVIFELDPVTGKVIDKKRQRSYVGVKSLLASDELANISGFAQTQVRAFRNKNNAPAIPARILFNEKLVKSEKLIDYVLAEVEKTSLVLIDGPAGVGKTFQIEQMLVEQANRCVAGQLAAPLLLVSSRGRRLSNLRDVMAAATQDMGADFNARQVTILVRHGLLSVAIDGFDELVDADGYEDSWIALRDFISEVGRGGIIILAARDTFVEEQELLDRIARKKSDICFSMAHIQTVAPSDAKLWLSKAPHWTPADIKSEITNDILSDESYALRPFFLKNLRDAGGWASVVEAGPRTFLVSRLMRREAVLIAQQLGGITSDQVMPSLIALMEEISLEMGFRESDSVEIDHLSFLTQYCFENVLDENSIRKLVHKSGSFALLELANTKDRRRFPHSEIQYYFLGGALVSALCAKTIPIVLRRSIFSAEHLDVFAEVFSTDEAAAKLATEFLSSMLSTEMSNDSFGMNGGAVILMSFGFGLITRADYLSVFESTFAGGSPSGILTESTISRLDITGSDISGVEFNNVDVGTLVIDEHTKFGPSLPQISALELRGQGVATISRDPEEIKKIVDTQSHPVKDVNNGGNSYITLLEKVVRRVIRNFYLREHGDDDDGSILLRDPGWPVVKQVLKNHNRLEVTKGKPMHGRPSPLIRVRRAKELLDRNDPETAAIFQDLVSVNVDGP